MEPQTIQNDVETESPLWLNVYLRLICGVIVAAILGAIGWWYGDKTMTFAGAVLGFACGGVYGQNALSAFWGRISTMAESIRTDETLYTPNVSRR